MKSLKVNLNKYVNHSLFKNLSIVFLESIITKALSFISILILSRQLILKIMVNIHLYLSL